MSLIITSLILSLAVVIGAPASLCPYNDLPSSQDGTLPYSGPPNQTCKPLVSCPINAPPPPCNFECMIGFKCGASPQTPFECPKAMCIPDVSSMNKGCLEEAGILCSSTCGKDDLSICHVIELPEWHASDNEKVCGITVACLSPPYVQIE